jgi:hypothetical protein
MACKNAHLSFPFIMGHSYVKWVGHGEISVIYFINCVASVPEVRCSWADTGHWVGKYYALLE